MSGTSQDPSTLADNFANNSDVWKPRFKVLVGREGVHTPTAVANIEVPTALSAQVLKSNWYQADRHKVVFSLWANPDYGYAFWQPGDSGFDTMSILVQIGFDGVVDFTEVFRGFVDKVVIDPIKGTVTLSGRNVLGLLIDTRMIQFSQNPTVGELINGVFTAAKLNPPDLSNIGEIAGLPTGREFLDEQSVGSVSDKSLLNPMDLLHSICTHYGLTMSEKEGVVSFYSEITGTGDVAFVIQAPVPEYEFPGVTKVGKSNCTSLQIEHDLNISQWDWIMMAVNTGNEGEAKTDQFPTGLDPLADTSKPYPLHSANKSHEDNVFYAQSMFQEFMMHELIITAKVAGPQMLGLSLNQKIMLTGTGTEPLDGWYAIDSIEHSIDFQRGYVGTVKGRWGRFSVGGTGGSAGEG